MLDLNLLPPTQVSLTLTFYSAPFFPGPTLHWPPPELGWTDSEVQFERAEFTKNANQLFEDVLSKDGLGGGVGVHVDELSLQTKEDM